MDRFVNNISRIRACAYAMLMVMIVFSLMSCQKDASKLKMSYDFVKSAEILYNSSHEILNSLDDQGKLTDEQKATIVNIAEKYYHSVQLAKSALVAYKTALDAGQETDITTAEVALRTAVAGMKSLEAELVELIMKAGA
jgi:hypothetical protein